MRLEILGVGWPLVASISDSLWHSRWPFQLIQGCSRCGLPAYDVCNLLTGVCLWVPLVDMTGNSELLTLGSDLHQRSSFIILRYNLSIFSSFNVCSLVWLSEYIDKPFQVDAKWCVLSSKVIQFKTERNMQRYSTTQSLRVESISIPCRSPKDIIERKNDTRGTLDKSVCYYLTCVLVFMVIYGKQVLPRNIFVSEI